MAKTYKYKKLKLQYSDNNGDTWYDSIPLETKKGDLIEENSEDCGYIKTLYQYIDDPTSFICIDVSKYTMLREQVSYDKGKTWEYTGQTKPGNMIEKYSEDCGYGIEWKEVPNEYICEEEVK